MRAAALFSRRRGAGTAFTTAPRPAQSTPWQAAGWCAVDLELTGLNPRRNRIIAIGAVPIDDGRLILGRSLYTLVRTEQRSEHAAVLTHKLLVADLADAPALDDALELLLDALAGRIPVFHTAAVERAFLGPAFRRWRLRLPDAVDTEVLGRAWLALRDGESPASLPLARLAATLGLPAESAHHALGDALTTAKAFIALASLLDAREPQTVASLLALGSSATRAWRRLGPAD